MLNDLLTKPVGKKEEMKEPTMDIGPGKPLNSLRQRVINGEEVSQEELAAAIKTLRDMASGATKAQAAKATKVPASKSKAKPAPKVDQEAAQNLLDNLL